MEAATESTSIKVQQKSILWSLSQGASRAAACRENDVDRATFYLWLDEEEGYEEKVEDAEQSSIDRMERLAYECAEKAATDPRYLRALFFVLKCKAGWSQEAPTDADIDWDRISYHVNGKARKSKPPPPIPLP